MHQLEQTFDDVKIIQNLPSQSGFDEGATTLSILTACHCAECHHAKCYGADSNNCFVTVVVFHTYYQAYLARKIKVFGRSEREFVFGVQR